MSSPTKQITSTGSPRRSLALMSTAVTTSTITETREEEWNLLSQSQHWVGLAYANPQQTPMNGHAANTTARHVGFAV